MTQRHDPTPGSPRSRPRADLPGSLRSSPPDNVPGMFTLVLHTHLPWLAHHGRWPVGEEWLYQSWSAAYLPLMRVLLEAAIAR